MAPKLNYNFSKNLRFAGNFFTGITLGYSAYQTFTGKATYGSFIYDGVMVGVAFIPFVGIPLSITGSIFKEEIMDHLSRPRAHYTVWALSYGERE
ncbi:MAG: hypothetical protein COB73_09500 [Flavobacteriaceae bacterium]|nr:MAG: hypothetical protein COB73_09500 [Flavobacteriaceae bacterium]